MAQMPIQSVAGRAEPYAPPPAYVYPPGSAAKPPAATPKISQAFDPGAISGGVLRPGSIDQMTFRQRLEAANRGGPIQHPAAGKSPLMAPPAAKGGPSIPTLTPAQLAALGVDISGLEAAPGPTVEAAAALATPEAAAPVLPSDATAIGPETMLDATQTPEAAPAAPAALQQAALPPEAADPDAPSAPVPGAHLGRDGVWELPRQPSKDEREWFQGMNAKWRIVENPESVKLFLGEDGKFGFDDFLDIINPLQHIPFVNMAYRALTGDQINGAAQMVGAVAMGPVSALSTVIDLAFKSETGEGLAANGIAMLFGGDEAPADVASYATAAGNVQTADLSQFHSGSNR